MALADVGSDMGLKAPGGDLDAAAPRTLGSGAGAPTSSTMPVKRPGLFKRMLTAPHKMVMGARKAVKGAGRAMIGRR